MRCIDNRVPHALLDAFFYGGDLAQAMQVEAQLKGKGVTSAHLSVNGRASKLKATFPCNPEEQVCGKRELVSRGCSASDVTRCPGCAIYRR